MHYQEEGRVELGVLTETQQRSVFEVCLSVCLLACLLACLLVCLWVVQSKCAFAKKQPHVVRVACCALHVAGWTQTNWVLDCCRVGLRLGLNPKYLLRMSKATEEALKEQVDEFGQLCDWERRGCMEE